MSTRRAAVPAMAAYMLHRHDWSESSLVVDLFTRERGRIIVVAKGAKRPYSQLRPVLLPFQRLTVTLVRGAPASEDGGEVQGLRAAEWAGGAPMPSGDGLFAGFYLNELLMKLLARNDPHPGLFDVYGATLPSLADPDDAVVQSALRAFELCLLRETGLLPELDIVTATQQPARDGAGHVLHPEAGVVEHRSADALDAAVMRALQAALSAGDGRALQAACRLQLQALKAQLRALLHYHLGSTRLRSRQLMRDLQRLTPVPA